VRDQGCNEVQGFLFSPPVSAQKVKEMLAAEERPKLRRAS
jgi:EAL domain-containing protein (putative c-di-GMP-specific phosphodiesterase class I)